MITEEQARDWLEAKLGTRDPSSAAIVALLLGNDCRNFRSVTGADIHVLCRVSGLAAAVCLHYADGSTCYCFLDDSMIVITTEGWEARQAGEVRRLKRGTIIDMEVPPRGRFVGRDITLRRNEQMRESDPLRSLGFTIDF